MNGVNSMTTDISIIMGSDSDLAAMKAAMEFLDEMGIGYKVQFMSAHRTANDMAEHARTARAQGYKVIIAGAGGAAHLPGMTEAFEEASVPVVAVPIKTTTMGGLDSLASILQMPPGRPVGTMAINGSKNAAIYAAQILAVSDDALAEKLRAFTDRMADEVRAKNVKLEKLGWKAYLEQMGVL